MFLGVDLAWGESTKAKKANQSGVVALEASGRIIDAGWTVGIEETVDWLNSVADEDSHAFIDAPLVVHNPAKTQRRCEKEVGQRYMSPWKVAANTTNVASGRLGGVRLRELLEADGWVYDDGTDASTGGRRMSECYPYTTITGVPPLGYEERPLYKRKPKKMKVADWRPLRASECDVLIRRIADLKTADPPVDLSSHETTAALLETASPLDDAAYKSREDLLDAVVCAWTASYWSRYGADRSQILGLGEDPDAAGRRATIIAPAKPEQRRDESSPKLFYLPLDLPERFVLEMEEGDRWVSEALCSADNFERSEENGVYYNSEIGMYFRVVENHLDHFVHVDQDGEGDRYRYRLVPVREDENGKIRKP